MDLDHLCGVSNVNQICTIVTISRLESVSPNIPVLNTAALKGEPAGKEGKKLATGNQY